ncbi:hypothetical protein D3C85_1873260 [compost metagenome]
MTPISVKWIKRRMLMLERRLVACLASGVPSPLKRSARLNCWYQAATLVPGGSAV